MSAAHVGEWAMRSALLIAVGALLLRALRVNDPAVRLAVWTALLAGSLSLPLLTAALPHIALRPALPSPIEEASGFWAFAPLSAAPAHPVGAPPFSTPAFDWARLAGFVYLLAGAVLLVRLAAGMMIRRRILRASRGAGYSADGIAIRESDDLQAPVALGILRPAIVLPSDWREWETPRFDAVIAHERAHIRRRDPAVQFASALHRTLLWFSPLSWYLDRRIVQAAEEASDDAAVAATHDRVSYAETLLIFFQRGVSRTGWQGLAMARYGSPEARIGRILDGTALSRGVTPLALAAIVAVGAPLTYVVAAAQAGDLPAFEVASVKAAEPLPASGVIIVRGSGGNPFPTIEPGRIHYPRESMARLLSNAFEVEGYQVEGPKWMAQETFEIDATMPPATPPHQLHLMMQHLLAERFHLAAHRVTKEFSGYSLHVAKAGLKLREGAAAPAPVSGFASVDKDGFPVALAHRPGAMPPPGRPDLPLGFFSPLGSRLFFNQRTIPYLAGYLAQVLRCPVADDTGLTAKYDFTLTYLPEGQAAPPDANYPPAPDLFTALEQQLGLRLDKKKIAAELVVVDHIEKTPTAN